MKNQDTAIAAMSLWLAAGGVVLAHPPYVQPWMHGVNLSVAGLAGIGLGLIVRRKWGLAAGMAAALVVALGCAGIGLFLSLLVSM